MRDKENNYRRDLCKDHLERTVAFYNKEGEEPQVFVVEIWGDDGTSTA